MDQIADTDREQIAERLRVAVGEGRLDLVAYDERVQRVYVARTRADLDATVRDLARPAVARPRPVERPTGNVRAWLAISAVMVTVWVAVSLMAGHPTYFWPVWPILGWGAALALPALTGQPGCGRQIQPSQRGSSGG